MKPIKDLAEHLEKDPRVNKRALERFNYYLENIRILASNAIDSGKMCNLNYHRILREFEKMDQEAIVPSAPESPNLGVNGRLDTTLSRSKAHEVMQRMYRPGQAKPHTYFMSVEGKVDEVIMGALENKSNVEPPRHCNFCWKETETREGDCVDCGFSKVPREKVDVKKWIGGGE